MTVGELQKMLAAFPAELPVVAFANVGGAGGHADILSVDEGDDYLLHGDYIGRLPARVVVLDLAAV